MSRLFDNIEHALFDALTDSPGLEELAAAVDEWKRTYHRSYRALRGSGRKLMDSIESAIAFDREMKEEQSLPRDEQVERCAPPGCE